MTTLLILVVAVIICLLLSVIFLQLAARILGSSHATFGRALKATFLTTLLGLALQGLTYQITALSPGAGLALAILISFVAVAVTCLIIQWTFETSLLKAGGIWLLSQVGTVAVLFLTLFVFRTFVLESWVISANSMAPTLLGEHYTATCPHCGGKSCISRSDVERPIEVSGESGYLAICSKCYRTSRTEEISDPLLPPDRFIANKLLAFHRWDVAVFRKPNDRMLPM